MATDTYLDDSDNNFSGSNGNDNIFAFGGNDTINGLGGDDLIDMGLGGGLADGGLGNDTLAAEFFGLTGGVAFNGPSGTATSSFLGILTFSNFESFHINGSAGNDTIIGGAGTDSLHGMGGRNRLMGGGGNDTLVAGFGGTISNYADGESGDDLVISDIGNDCLLGGVGNDTIRGFAGNDTLRGGLGTDCLAGGDHNDFYEVDSPSDILIELAGEGYDMVCSSISWTLGPYLEDLSLTGSAVINGTGNALPNGIVGNAAANMLDGKAGADTMAGGGGNDTYSVDSTGDVVQEVAGLGRDGVGSSITYTLPVNVENLSLTGGSSINGTGNTLPNQLVGNAAANTLDGKAGSDVMVGLGGNDIYFVDSVGDVVQEGVGLGQDAVASSVTYTLPVNVENLSLTGGGPSKGTGNALNNHVFGNGSANTLDGKAGADTMAGGGGNDTYFVDQAGDVIQEAAGPGRDGVASSVTYTLPVNVENLSLTGGAPIKGTGNALPNHIFGNGNGNTLDGKAGADTMAGGGGNDTYFVDQAGDVIQEAAGPGRDGVASSVTYTLPVNVENLSLTGIALVNGTGNVLANRIDGNASGNNLSGNSGNDTVDGGGGNDHLNGDSGHDLILGGVGHDFVNGFNAGAYSGFRDIDTLTGGLGMDRFVLGAAPGRLYDDGVATNPGRADYALLTDFTPAQGDKLQLKGSASQYFFGSSPVAGVPGTALYHDSNGNGVLNTPTDELIAILRSPGQLTQANTIATAVFL